MKNQEIRQAIELLKSVKDAYEKACRQIDKQVDELQYDTIPGIPVRIPKSNVSINWNKVEEMKLNSIDWNKVVELIQQVIPPQNVEKIKNANNPTKINEYKNLTDFVVSKLNSLQVKKVKYICYWKTVKATSSASKSKKDFDFVKNAWWILGGIGALIGLIVYPGWGIAIGVAIGVIVGLIVAGIFGIFREEANSIAILPLLIFPTGMGAIIGQGVVGAGVGAIIGGIFALVALLSDD